MAGKYVTVGGERFDAPRGAIAYRLPDVRNERELVGEWVYAAGAYETLAAERPDLLVRVKTPKGRRAKGG